MLREYLSNIADKFRTYLDTTEPINAQDFAGKVEDVAVRYNQLGFTSGREVGYNQGLETGTEQGKPLGKLELLQDSEYMNAKVSGAAISVNDVSPIEHSVGCSVESKNMLDPRSYVDTSNQGTVRILDDGLVELSGAFNGDTYAEITYNFVVTEPCALTLWFEENYGWKVNAYLNDTQLNSMNETTISVTLSVGTHKLRLFQGNQSTSGTYIQLEKGTAPTDYTPYLTDLSSVEVKRYGKNMLPTTFNNVLNWEKIDNDRRFYFNDLIVGQTYTLSLKRLKTLNNYGFFRFYKFKNGAKETLGTFSWGHTAGLASSSISFTVESEHEYYVYGLFTGSQGMLENGVFVGLGDFQLELGDKKTPYEPYIEPTTYQANPNGIVDGVTSISPNMTLIPSNDGVVINANYLRDIDTYIDNLITDVALTGGE